ncbi:MAG: conjugal transfer protein TrbF [Sphingomonas sp.]
MKFKRSVQRYGRTPEPQTPYQRAGQVWDERIGAARVQARNWRLMALGGLALSSALSGGLMWLSMQSRVVPYVVEVDRLGEPRAIEPAQQDHRPTDPELAWHLARFITDVRSISLDPVLMRSNWLSAYDFATARGARFLSSYARSTNPFGEVGVRTVSVQVTSVVRASDSSFEVKWTENEFERGNPAGTSHWTAILSVVTRPPATSDTLRKNPLGIYVDAIDWSRELDPGPLAAPAGPGGSTGREIPTGSPLEAPLQSSPPARSNR